MRFCIEQEIFRMFPNFCRGVVMAAGIDNRRPCPELEALLQEQQENMRTNAGMDLATHPRLLAWKEAYRLFGSNPNKFTPSIVFLAKQVKSEKPVRSISPAVDVFNCISLKYVIPCGGDDMDSVEGDVTLGRAVSDETFAPIFKPEEMEHPDPGEVIYVNRRTKRVLCRRWNWRNADFSKILPETRNLAINVDGMQPAIGRPEIEQAAEELQQLLRRFCGGSISIHYLDAQHPDVEVEF
ncbi:MAG TPA: phenylalanine--tRNA ligase beta subunit-related protein [Acidobacteriota bacterium]|nr:phenylalanine--tRNA ligase beta subunit-related protein [Acidobacteriota bacterium]